MFFLHREEKHFDTTTTSILLLNDNTDIAIICNYISKGYTYKGNHNDAIQYYINSLTIYQSSNNNAEEIL